MSPKNYEAHATLQSLQKGGWKAKETTGMPQTMAHVKQIGYVETTTPAGQNIDLQFLEDADKAARELKAATDHGMGMFTGTTIGNVLVFAHPMGETKLPKADLEAIEKLLK